MLAPLLRVRLHLEETETEIITSLNCWAIVVRMKLNWFYYWLQNCVVYACSLMHSIIFIIRLVVSNYSKTFFVQLFIIMLLLSNWYSREVLRQNYSRIFLLYTST